MSEQQRIRKITRRRESAAQDQPSIQAPAPLEEQRAVDERLSQLDTAINQIVGQPQAAIPSEVAGERLRSRMRILSSEELWKQFIQKGGE